MSDSDRNPPEYWSPTGVLPNRVRPFKFRYKDGVESFSFLLGSWGKTGPCRDVFGSGDIDRVKFWVCRILGRDFDLHRCEKVGARPVETESGPDIEVRVSFGLPWYAKALEIKE
jgi:hypothetical protein